MAASENDNVQEYRHGAKRPNNPPAGLASHGPDEADENLHYRFDPHLPPKLRFDQTGDADDLPDGLPELLQKATTEGLTEEEAQTIADALHGRQQPWLEWTDKRQKHDVEVQPTALHTHERVSAQAIIKSLEREDVQRNLFADPQLPYHEAVQFYQHDVDWTNRLILGDSLEVMSSLAHRENLAGQVQMIYLDPPYGINFRSNFQPKVTSASNRGRQKDLTREPEMVKAYRDTWKLGIHSYLDYLRDRLVLCRELLKDSGSIFVQIGEENLHLIRCLMDEVFGRENAVSTITFTKTSGFSSTYLSSVTDYIVWYAKDKENLKYNPLYRKKTPGDKGATKYRPVSTYGNLPNAQYGGDRNAVLGDLTSQGRTNTNQDFRYRGRIWNPSEGRHWMTVIEGMHRLAGSERVVVQGNRLRYVRFLDDFPIYPISNVWTDVGGIQDRTRGKMYVVQTTSLAVRRCMLMASDPGDLVLDPTCGSGTTAEVAEKWGRRWITIDTSRVALAIARQRMLTSTFPMFKTESANEHSDPGKGFIYKTVPHIKLSDIAKNDALDPIFEKHQPILDERLAAANNALSAVTDDLRRSLKTKLKQKQKAEGKRAITDADERRWRLPDDGETWEHWEVPFDTDEDWPDALKEAVTAYRTAWRKKMDEVNTAIAEGSEQEVLYDQPEVVKGVTRVSGPFTVEAVMPPEESLTGADSPIGGTPAPSDATFETNGSGPARPGPTDTANADSYLDKMTRLMAEDGVRFMNNEDVAFERLERTTGASYLHADGVWASENGADDARVAVSFGPEHGPVTGKQVEHAMREAFPRGYDAVVFAGFSFNDAAQVAIQEFGGQVDLHMAHIRPDVKMQDLLYRPKSEQLFTVFGLPRTTLHNTDDGFQIEMEGVDVYNPVKGQINATDASKVAAWFVDTDYDRRTFCISQAFFPKKKTWKKLQKALKGTIDKEQFAKLTGTTSLPFEAGEHNRAAVKVIDPRGNEVMRVHDLS